jgi:HAE1 family hydrophobic/amphiphilic exporter-1
MLKLSLRLRWLVVLFAIGFFASSIYIAGFIGSEFIPQADENQFNIQVEAPIGTSIEASDRLLAEIERRVWQQLPDGVVTDVFTTIGSGVTEEVHKATVLVKLVPKADRTQSQFELMDQARGLLADLKQLDLSVEVVPRIAASGYSVAPFQYYIGGTDLKEIVEFSKKMEKELVASGMLIDMNSSWNEGKPELPIIPNRQKATMMGVSTRDISDATYTLIGGRDVSTFEDHGKSFDVRVRLAQEDRDRIDSVLSIPVRTGSGELIDLRNVVDSAERLGPVQIDRRDRKRQVTLMANIAPGKVLGDAMTKAREIEAKIGVPATLATGFTGEAQDMVESFGYIFTSMFLAVLLIYMVLAAQFESLIHPFTIMITLPLSITGALGGLFLAGSTISIFSLIGMIMLMGLVTKNAILLIDYTNQLRAQGMERNEAILRAGPVRLRPIMMTAMSTIAGMLPAALGMGEGAETRSPMGICIVGGMVTSTVLTLVVIPVVYTILDDISRITKRLFSIVPGASSEISQQMPALAAEESAPLEEEVAYSSDLEEKPILRLDTHEPQSSPSESSARTAEKSS